MSRLPVIVTVALAIGSALPAHAARFVPLGILDNRDFSQGKDVSADGTVVVGQSASDDGAVAFRWTEATGMVALGFLSPTAPDSDAWGISPDSETIVGEASGTRSFIWTNATGMQELPLGTRAFATSNGGARIVGTGAGLTLGNDVTPDGSVWVGADTVPSGQEAFVETIAGRTYLGELPGFDYSSVATAVTPDGHFIVGQSNAVLDPDGRGADVETTVATYWQGTAGPFVIGDLPGGGHGSTASDVSPDKRVVVGWGESDIGTEAYRWTPWGGIESIRELLLAEGIDTVAMGWNLTFANAVSADGRIIVGTGRNPQGIPEAFLVELNVPEPSAVVLLAVGLVGAIVRRSRR